MTDHTSELKHSINPNSTAGECLRFARDAHGYTQEEVAKALCLNINIIQALEDDNCHRLAVPVFVQGYLRNYENFLKIRLPRNAINNLKPAEPIAIEKHQTAKANFYEYLFAAKSYLIKLLNYGMVIAFALLIFIWWHDRQYANESRLSILTMSAARDPFSGK